MELLIAIVLVSVIVTGFFSIELFGRRQLLSSNRLSEVQNNGSYVLEHMQKQIAKAIGGINNSAVDTTDIGGDTAIQVWIDYNQSGQRDAGDREIAYRFTGSPAYQIKYCPQCTNGPCTNCNPDWSASDILSSKIKSFSRTYDNTETDGDPRDDYVEVQLTACWNPDGSPYACGTANNPQITLETRIKMSSVSTN